jgi:twitching motility two-component system response regulator PilH
MPARKVLAVDDSAADLTNIRNVLTEAGCMVVTASNGKEAFDKAKSDQPDMIFLDIIMPEMDGYETCRMLANNPDTKNIPVVFVTSKGQKADRVWAQMQGGKDLVQKPYTKEQIVEMFKYAA